MNTAISTALVFCRRWSGRTCCLPRWTMAPKQLGLCITVGIAVALAAQARRVAADDAYSANAARLEKMTPDQKDDLRRKKLRFDALSLAEQQKLRELHTEIT